MPTLAKEFASGEHPEAVLDCINLCFLCDKPVPQWAQEEFRRLHWLGESGALKSWDHAFGRPNTRGAFERQASDDYNAARVLKAVVEANRVRGEPIDDLLFDEIGEELGIGRKTKVKSFMHCYLYNVDFAGDEIVTRSADPECDMARALLDRGVAGVVQIIDGQTGKPRSRVNVEKAAKLRTREGPLRFESLLDRVPAAETDLLLASTPSEREAA